MLENEIKYLFKSNIISESEYVFLLENRDILYETRNKDLQYRDFSYGDKLKNLKYSIITKLFGKDFDNTCNSLSVKELCLKDNDNVLVLPCVSDIKRIRQSNVGAKTYPENCEPEYEKYGNSTITRFHELLKQSYQNIKYNLYTSFDSLSTPYFIDKINLDFYFNSIKYKECFFDKILISAVLSKFKDEDDDIILIQCDKILKDNGIIIIADTNSSSKKGNVTANVSDLIKDKNDSVTAFNSIFGDIEKKKIDRDTLQQFFKKHKYNILKEYVSSYSWYSVFQKDTKEVK